MKAASVWKILVIVLWGLVLLLVNYHNRACRLEQALENIRLNLASFVAVDKESGKPLRVEVTLPSGQVAGTKISLPQVVFFPVEGLIRVIWVSGDQEASFKLSAGGGYKPAVVTGKSFRASNSESGEHVQRIEMEKTEQK